MSRSLLNIGTMHKLFCQRASTGSAEGLDINCGVGADCREALKIASPHLLVQGSSALQLQRAHPPRPRMRAHPRQSMTLPQ